MSFIWNLVSSQENQNPNQTLAPPTDLISINTLSGSDLPGLTSEDEGPAPRSSEDKLTGGSDSPQKASRRCHTIEDLETTSSRPSPDKPDLFIDDDPSTDYEASSSDTTFSPKPRAKVNEQTETWTTEGPFTVTAGEPENNNNLSTNSTNSSIAFSDEPLLKRRARSLSPEKIAPVRFSQNTVINRRERSKPSQSYLRARSFPTCKQDYPKEKESEKFTLCERFQRWYNEIKTELIETWYFAVEEFFRFFSCGPRTTRQRPKSHAV